MTRDSNPSNPALHFDLLAADAIRVMMGCNVGSAPGCYDGRSRLVSLLSGFIPDVRKRRPGAGPLFAMRQGLFPDRRCLRGGEHLVRPAWQPAVRPLPTGETARAGGAEPRTADRPVGAGGCGPVGAGRFAASVVPARRRDSTSA